MKSFFLILAILSFSFKENELKTLFHTLEPKSAAQALAFYELYPKTDIGKLALERVTKLFGLKETSKAPLMIRLINRLKGQDKFSDEELDFIEELASKLPNRELKGYFAQSEKEVIALDSEHIDIGKALLLSQLDGHEDVLAQARSYSAMLDLMAMQILSQLSSCPSVEDKIEKTNQLIFEEMRFRFPPQSIYAEEIDRFTFLPSVMDDHLGVCLGVTALYLAIAQRIDLPLEIITPPGHIYIRYRDEEHTVNIETTARGIHVPSETYLSVGTRSLQLRTLKEVIGMTHVNQASVYLQGGLFEKAARSYEKARQYMPHDPLVCELCGYSYLLMGKKDEGEKLLSSIRDFLPEESIVKHKMAEDYLEGRVNLEGIQAVFTHVDDTRDSILAKIKKLQNVITQYPLFRDGLEQLAVSWIQINRAKEATDVLKRYHEIDSENPIIEYYLSVLHGERYDFKNSWKYLKNAERITSARDFHPKALKELKHSLMLISPDE